MKTKKKMKTGFKILLGISAFLLIIISAFLIYGSDYYHSDDSAIIYIRL